MSARVVWLGVCAALLVEAADAGVMWMRVSDGETRRFQTGDVIQVLDVAPSKGHTSAEALRSDIARAAG